MTKEERLELTLKGFRVLRAKFDYHVCAWRIYSHTKSPGYEIYSHKGYASIEFCEKAILEMCQASSHFIFEPFNEFNFYKDGPTTYEQHAGAR